MPFCAPVILAAFLFEHGNRRMAPLLYDFRADFGVVDPRAADQKPAVFLNKAYLRQLDDRPDISRQRFEFHNLTWLYTILFAAGFNDGVHLSYQSSLHKGCASNTPLFEVSSYEL